MPVENLRGSLLMVLAMAGFAIEDMLIKQMTSNLPIGQVLAMIGCGGAIIFSILARLRGRSLAPPRAYWRPLVLRNLGEMVAAPLDTRSRDALSELEALDTCAKDLKTVMIVIGDENMMFRRDFLHTAGQGTDLQSEDVGQDLADHAAALGTKSAFY
jgi:hypothetical protein